ACFLYSVCPWPGRLSAAPCECVGGFAAQCLPLFVQSLELASDPRLLLQQVVELEVASSNRPAAPAGRGASSLTAQGQDCREGTTAEQAVQDAAAHGHPFLPVRLHQPKNALDEAEGAGKPRDGRDLSPDPSKGLCQPDIMAGHGEVAPKKE